MELDRKRGGERKKESSISLLSPNHFSFGGTSAVFLPDSHFARQQYTSSSRSFDAVFRRRRLFSTPPSLPYLLAGHPLCPHGGRGGGRRRQKCIFRERFAVIGSHHVRGKCSLFKRYSAPNRLQFSHRWHNRWRRRRGRNVASVSPNIVSTSFRD